MTHHFAPELVDRMALIRDVPRRQFGVEMAPEHAALLEQFDAPFGPSSLPDVEVRDAVVDGPHGPVPVRIYTPKSEATGPRNALVWMHGGAFIFGDLDMPEGDHVSKVLSGTADVVVVSVDYRLAVDGVHFPVPHDDCLAAYQWTIDSASDLGINPDRVAVGGGSAGGNLAAGLALHLRDLGTPCWQALLAYPATHPVSPPWSNDLREAIAVLPPVLAIGSEHDEDTRIAENYIGGPVESAHPYCFPGLADDLTGFPPTLVNTDEFDTLRAAGEQFARQLQAAGVDVELMMTPGVPHGHLNSVGSPTTATSLERYAERLRGEF